jgi:hypothetical protein
MVSVCSLLDSVFRPVVKQKYHGRRACHRKAAHLMVARKERDRKKKKVRNR